MPKPYMLLLSFLLLVTTGCKDQKTVEDLGFVHTIGFDRVTSGEQKGKLLVTISFPLTNTDGLSRQTISTIANTGKEARIFLSRQTDKNLVSGQIRSILIGEELAKEGFWDELDSLERDPIIGTRLKLSIVKGRAHDLLTRKYPYFPNLDISIVTLLDKEAQVTYSHHLRFA